MATPYHTLDRAFFDDLEELHAAYDSLAILACTSDVESRHVSAVLSILNIALERRIASHSERQPHDRHLRAVE